MWTACIWFQVVKGSCEYGNEPSVFLKEENFVTVTFSRTTLLY